LIIQKMGDPATNKVSIWYRRVTAIGQSNLIIQKMGDPATNKVSIWYRRVY
jgi:hypothetical protein